MNELGRSFKSALLIEDYGSTVLRGCRPDLPRQRLDPLSSDLDDALTLIHRAAAGALGEVEIGKIFEDVIADSADDEILAPLIFPPFAKDLGRDPGEEEGAKDADEINGDHSIEGNVKHGGEKLGFLRWTLAEKRSTLPADFDPAGFHCSSRDEPQGRLDHRGELRFFGVLEPGPDSGDTDPSVERDLEIDAQER